MNPRRVFKLLTSAVAIAECLESAAAQQVTGVPGSPGADLHRVQWVTTPASSPSCAQAAAPNGDPGGNRLASSSS
jgi:hypothetical protein